MKNIKIKKWQKYPEKKVLLLFNYVPIFGWIYFVFDYIPGVPILECDFMGLDYFKMIMKDANVIRALKNTFIFAGISIILTPLPMIFAILLNEIKSGPVRKFVQTFTIPSELHQLGYHFLPGFLSVFHRRPSDQCDHKDHRRRAGTVYFKLQKALLLVPDVPGSVEDPGLELHHLPGCHCRYRPAAV